MSRGLSDHVGSILGSRGPSFERVLTMIEVNDEWSLWLPNLPPSEACPSRWRVRDRRLAEFMRPDQTITFEKRMASDITL